MTKRPITSAAAAALALAVAATASSANDLYWQGTDGSVDSPNYFDATTSTAGVGAGGTDSLYIGAGSTLTQVSNLTTGRLILGHDGTSTPSITATTTTGGFAGAGTVNVTGGTLSLTSTIVNTTVPAGLTANPEAGLIVGFEDSGSLSISNAAVTVADSAVVGFSLADSSVSGTLTINAGGSLALTKGGLQLGANGTSTVAGAGGSVIVNGGTLNISESGGDLVIGVWNKSSFTQTGGITTVADETFVGRRNADFTTFALSGGTLNTRQFHVADWSGDGRPDDVSATISDATLNSTSTVDVGAGNSRRASLTIGHGANVTGGAAFNVAGGNAIDTTVTIGSTAKVTFTGNMVVGGGASANRTNVTITDSATFKAATVNIGNGANTTATGTNNSTLTLSGDAVVNTAGINVGSATGANNSSLVVSGNAKLTGSAGINVGTGATNTSNSSVTFKDNAVVKLNNGLTLGLTNDSNAVLNVNDNASLSLANSGNSDVHLFIGRGSSTATLNMTGGSILSPNYVLIGTATSAAAVQTINHSGGTITAGTNLTPAGPSPITVRVGFKVGDTAGTSTYNLSGTGAINVANGLMIVGRVNSVATFNQTGGTVTASGGLHIGEAETATAASQTGTGTYVLSGGTINASVPTASTVAALAVGNADTGTLRVVGGDATVNVTGDVLVNTGAASGPTPARVGTLAYKLETGESLTKINATGTATFSAASVLSLDLNGVASPASSYDLITAADVINNGLVLSVPAGWHMDLVDGATTKTLQFVNAINGDANRNGKIDADDYALIDRGFNKQAQWWHNGDFNDNGVIDAQDYLLIDTALGQQNGGHLSPRFLATRDAQFGDGYVANLIAAVPEPGTLSVLAAGVLPLLARRRRCRAGR